MMGTITISVMAFAAWTIFLIVASWWVGAKTTQLAYRVLLDTAAKNETLILWRNKAYMVVEIKEGEDK